MSVDEFFQGGFDAFIDGNTSRSQRPTGKLGKRKRDVEIEGQDQESLHSDSDGSFGLSGEDNPMASDLTSTKQVDDSDGEEADLGMSDMEDLKKHDPEFYKFLKEEEPEAFNFNPDLAEIDELSTGDEEPTAKKQRVEESMQEDTRGNELTKEQVARWKVLLLEQHSLRAARQVVLAFRSAAHLNEDDEDLTAQRYTIDDPDVYHDLLILALSHIPPVIQHHVPVKESASGKVHFQAQGRKFKTLSNLIKSYTSSILLLLGTLSDDATLKVTISALEPLAPYLLSFRKLLKHVIKMIVSFWGRHTSSDSTRVTAFLVIRRLIVIGDYGVRESTLKAVYEGFLQSSRKTNINTVKGLNLMKNSAAELWGIDQQVGYTTAFTSIRQLAIHLRNSIVHNQNDSYKAVYNWQYVHALDFWSCVLAEHCNPLKEAETGKESALRQLIFPLVQVAIGAMRLVQSPLYFPLRFHTVRSLLRISQATDTFIPLAPFMLEVLASAEMKHPAKSTAKVQPLDFALNYKAPKIQLRTRLYQEGIGEQVIELLSEFFYFHSKSIAFPELALPVIVMLKRWLKITRKAKSGHINKKVESNMLTLVQKMEDNTKFIEQKRAKVEFAPRNRTQVESFLRDFSLENTPLGAYVETQRTLRMQRAKDEEDAREAENRRKKQVEKDKKTEDNTSDFEDDADLDDLDNEDRMPSDVDMEYEDDEDDEA